MAHKRTTPPAPDQPEPSHGDEQKASEAGCDGSISTPIETRTCIKTLTSFLEAPGEKTQQSLSIRTSHFVQPPLPTCWEASLAEDGSERRK